MHPRRLIGRWSVLVLAFGLQSELLAATSLAVEGTEFVLRADDGSVRRSAQLLGAELTLPSGVTIRIDAVERERTPGGTEVWLHQWSTLDANGQWLNACATDPKGRRLGFPLPGRIDAQGNFVLDAGTVSLTCTAGARGKCVRFGYAPWARSADGTALLDHYNACVRMARADYCGNDRPYTRDGTIIDLYDRLGIQTSDSDAAFRFEAGWTPAGAVCIEHPRIPEHGDLASILAECPRLRAMANGEACTEVSAERAGALLFNRSR